MDKYQGSGRLLNKFQVSYLHDSFTKYLNDEAPNINHFD